MSAPIVYFDIAGPDGGKLKEFYSTAFGWTIDAHFSIAAASTGGLKGGIRQDPAEKVLYFGVPDIVEALKRIEVLEERRCSRARSCREWLRLPFLRTPRATGLGWLKLAAMPAKASRNKVRAAPGKVLFDLFDTRLDCVCANQLAFRFAG